MDIQPRETTMECLLLGFCIGLYRWDSEGGGEDEGGEDEVLWSRPTFYRFAISLYRN